MAIILYFTLSKPGGFQLSEAKAEKPPIVIYKPEIQPFSPAKAVLLEAVARRTTQVPEPKNPKRSHLALAEYAKMSPGGKLSSHFPLRVNGTKVWKKIIMRLKACR